MALKMMYITNKPEVAKIAEKYTVDRIWVDLEKNGKSLRQRGMNTVQSTHKIQDVSIIRENITKAELMVRVNPIYERSHEEINEVIKRGTDIVMLPYFETLDEVKKFIDIVEGRAKTILLLETIGAEKCIEKILEEVKVDEIHIGLNDLHLQYKMSFMFELLANGKVDEICSKIRNKNVTFGFGGIARLDEGMLPARHIMAEHYRLGSQMTILSRSFYDSWISNDLEEIERVFKHGMNEIREYEQRLMNETAEFFEKNRRLVIEEVENIVSMKRNLKNG